MHNVAAIADSRAMPIYAIHYQAALALGWDDDQAHELALILTRGML